MEKRPVGRPRRYKTNAARYRAYRKRLKRASNPRQAAKDARYALMRLGEQAALVPDSVSLWQGDFLEMDQQIPDHSGDLVLCDPPYGAEWLPHVEPFAVLCARVLKPGAGPTHDVRAELSDRGLTDLAALLALSLAVLVSAQECRQCGLAQARHESLEAAGVVYARGVHGRVSRRRADGGWQG
jgi:hypothetical protein